MASPRKVALLIETSNRYARELLRGVRAWVREHEAWTIRLTEQGRGAAVPKWLHGWDGDGVIADKWLKAAGKSGIPCAFVVSKGKLAWIGHPAKLEQPLLDSILAGTFDISAFAKEQEKEEAAGNYFKQNVMPLLRNKDTAGAIGALEKMKTEFPDQEKTINGHIERLKAQLPKETP